MGWSRDQVHQAVQHPWACCTAAQEWPASFIPSPFAKSAAHALTKLLLLLLLLLADALAVRQVFVWNLGNGVGGAAGAKAVRIALYNR
jgi:hypothetical protein